MPLQKVYDRGPLTNEITGTYSSKSSKALWKALSTELDDSGILEKSTMFTPDGAAVFGAAQAEKEGAEEGAVEGKNVVYKWSQWRAGKGLDPLDTIHCVAHRGSLANKDTIDEWHNSYMHMLTKQWHHFQESPECVTDLKQNSTEPRATSERSA